MPPRPGAPAAELAARLHRVSAVTVAARGPATRRPANDGRVLRSFFRDPSSCAGSTRAGQLDPTGLHLRSGVSLGADVGQRRGVDRARTARSACIEITQAAEPLLADAVAHPGAQPSSHDRQNVLTARGWAAPCWVSTIAVRRRPAATARPDTTTRGSRLPTARRPAAGCKRRPCSRSRVIGRRRRRRSGGAAGAVRVLRDQQRLVFRFDRPAARTRSPPRRLSASSRTADILAR